MPHFVDVHRGNENATPEELAAAHDLDVATQDKYGVKYHKYWFDPERGTVYCYVEAPDEESCHAVHEEAHGMMADQLIRVDPRQVEVFLGDGTESPDGTALRPDGSLDPAFRVILVTRIANLAAVESRMGDGVGAALVQRHDEIVRDALGRCGGREARHTGEGLTACFSSTREAMRCAGAILKAAEHAQDGAADPNEVPDPGIGIGMTVGEPVERNYSLFGVSVNLAGRIAELAEPGEILVSDGVRELAGGNGFDFVARGPARLRSVDEPVGLHAFDWKEWRAPNLVETESPPAIDPGPRGDGWGERMGWARRTIVEFARELRRRHVVRVALVYAVVVFMVIQAADLLVPALLLPEWVFRAVALIGILGFPFSLVLAWAFELAPGGSVRREDPAP